MKQRVHFITLATDDLDAARAFYRDGLGWEPLMDVPGEILFFQIAPGQMLGLFDTEKFSQDLGGTIEVGGVSGLTLAHNVDSPSEVERTVGEMAEAGARILKAPRQGDFGGVFHGLVQDPNGVIWEIAHNPGWRVEDDGTVVFG
ncbi:VOC family protein [Nocardiopsis alba]|uniref:VOC family protein n=1 Tax=Nocardiopsis alba TaxID=53437 RepID=A0A7K2IYR8_9ACTN|nr:VOC family protein [Nocardiopsis alba]MYR34957.1 VOC family protein [Nocardiopsis alba]